MFQNLVFLQNLIAGFGGINQSNCKITKTIFFLGIQGKFMVSKTLKYKMCTLLKTKWPCI